MRYLWLMLLSFNSFALRIIPYNYTHVLSDEDFKEKDRTIYYTLENLSSTLQAYEIYVMRLTPKFFQNSKTITGFLQSKRDDMSFSVFPKQIIVSPKKAVKIRLIWNGNKECKRKYFPNIEQKYVVVFSPKPIDISHFLKKVVEQKENTVKSTVDILLEVQCPLSISVSGYNYDLIVVDDNKNSRNIIVKNTGKNYAPISSAQLPDGKKLVDIVDKSCEHMQIAPGYMLSLKKKKNVPTINIVKLKITNEGDQHITVVNSSAKNILVNDAILEDNRKLINVVDRDYWNQTIPAGAQKTFKKQPLIENQKSTDNNSKKEVRSDVNSKNDRHNQKNRPNENSLKESNIQDKIIKHSQKKSGRKSEL